MSVKRYTNELRHGRFHTLTEDEDGNYVLHADYAALKEIAAEQSITILRLHEEFSALREAVKWERECEHLFRYKLDRFCWLPNSERGVGETELSFTAARAEVDRLLEEK